MGTIALLGDHDGTLSRIKARLTGAQQTVIMPLVQQQIADLMSEHLCQSVATHYGCRR